MPGTMPDAMTTLLASIGLGHLEPRLRDEAVDDTTFLDLDEEGGARRRAGLSGRRRVVPGVAAAPAGRVVGPGRVIDVVSDDSPAWPGGTLDLLFVS